jgi:glycosyltransferase involved in cell wall biosynthesis
MSFNILRSSSVQLSVALVTCNRPDSLERGLASLRSQSIQPFEVIISDDSEKDHAKQVQQLAAQYGGIYCAGPRRGLYANRNFAAQQCRGSHIRTMDDDHILPLDHLSRCIDAVQSDPSSIWTVGEFGYLNGAAVGAAETANQLGPSGVGEPIVDRDDNWGIADGSTIYPREVFDRGFRMVEEFAFGSSYLEFGAYLYKNGWRCRCVPKTEVKHYATDLARADPLSQWFASICFNRYFRPNNLRLARYLIPYWRNWIRLRKLFEMAHRRWSNL